MNSLFVFFKNSTHSDFNFCKDIFFLIIKTPRHGNKLIHSHTYRLKVKDEQAEYTHTGRK